MNVRFLTLTAIALLVGACRSSSPSRDDTIAGQLSEALPDSSPVLGRRADSLAALDPAREAAMSAARGDFRFVGTCGYACGVFGSAHDTISASSERGALVRDSLRIIEGTSDAVLNRDIARLDSIGVSFANRYNLAMLRERLARRRRDQPPNER